MSKLSEARNHVRSLDMATAQRELAEHRKQLFHLRLQLSRGEVKNNRQFAQVKADIARLMFHISELNREVLAEAEQDEHEAAAEEAAAASTAESSAESSAKA
ncbi:MAG TPA: 50S ribosomal protein L29 [Ktedonobacterales bacterium]|nr:50S ribosomal protein L29 [Ktedonobacterales bacterium]